MHSPSYNIPLIAALILLPSLTIAENRWLYPDPKTSPTYNKIDILNASWTTDYDQPQLVLWCTSDGTKTWDHSTF